MSDRRRLVRTAAPAILVVLLAAAWLAPFAGGLRLSSDDEAVTDRWQATLEGLPGSPLVVVGFDPDVGTYPEIRPTVRTFLGDLLARDARLAIVSLTPEGRALAVAELARLGRAGVNPTRIADLGFVPGAEAALVSLARSLPAAAENSALARRLAQDGMEGAALVAVVGGNDLGPRTWVEQVATRIDVPLVAIAPTVLLPELQPYVGSGQLDALLATPRDGAAYRALAELGALERVAEPVDRLTLPVLVGSVVAFLVIGQALVARAARAGRMELP